MVVDGDVPCEIDARGAECRDLKEMAESALLSDIRHRIQYAEDGIVGKARRYAWKLRRTGPYVHDRASASSIGQRAGRKAVRRPGISATGSGIDDAGVESDLRGEPERARAGGAARVAEREQRGIRDARSLESLVALVALSSGRARRSGRAHISLVALVPLVALGSLDSSAGQALEALVSLGTLHSWVRSLKALISLRTLRAAA